MMDGEWTLLGRNSVSHKPHALHHFPQITRSLASNSKAVYLQLNYILDAANTTKLLLATYEVGLTRSLVWFE